MKIMRFLLVLAFVMGCSSGQRAAPPSETLPAAAAPQGELGEYKVEEDGRAVWPPQGEGCEKLVACCTELAKLTEDLALMCQLAIARDRDCPTALTTVVAITAEQSYSAPQVCQP